MHEGQRSQSLQRQATKAKNSAQQQQKKDQSAIQSLQQEVETLKREKRFI